MMDPKFFPVVDELLQCLQHPNSENTPQRAAGLLYKLTVNKQIPEHIFSTFITLFTLNGQQNTLKCVREAMQTVGT